MRQHTPPHPGTVIKDIYLENSRISMNKVARQLGVSHSTFNRLIRGQISISPPMAIRLEKVIGLNRRGWLGMQAEYDLWEIQKNPENYSSLTKFDFS